MSIKIIKPGINNFEMKCPKCECVFEYSLEDLRPDLTDDLVECPGCKKLAYHSWRREDPWTDFIDTPVEPEPVKEEKKHGYWVASYDHFLDSTIVKCSQCGYSRSFDGRPDRSSLPDTCPTCGAIMEGSDG